MIDNIHKKTPQFTLLYLELVASITLLLGTILIIGPGFISNLFFDTTSNSVDFFVRMLGSTLIGYGSDVS